MDYLESGCKALFGELALALVFFLFSCLPSNGHIAELNGMVLLLDSHIDVLILSTEPSLF